MRLQGVRGQVAVEDRDPVMVKGKSKAIQIYRATGILESTVASASSPSRATQAMPPHRPQ